MRVAVYVQSFDGMDRGLMKFGRHRWLGVVEVSAWMLSKTAIEAANVKARRTWPNQIRSCDYLSVGQLHDDEKSWSTTPSPAGTGLL